MEMVMSVCINASKAQVWKVLADVENISLWSSAVVSAKTEDIKTGVGTRRTCELSNNSTFFEEWTEWVENEFYTYQGFELPLMKTAQNTWSVKALNAEETLLTTHAEVVLKGGFLGRCLEPLMRLAFTIMGRQSLAAFKYFVEEKKPFSGPHRMLPKPLAACS